MNKKNLKKNTNKSVWGHQKLRSGSCEHDSTIEGKIGKKSKLI